MALTTFAIGDDFVRDENGKTKFPKAGYTPAIGDLAVIDTSIADGFDLAAADEVPSLYVDWVASDSTYATTRDLVPGTTMILPISGAVALGDKIECTGSKAATGTGGPSRSVIRADNINGGHLVIGTGASSPAGTGTCVVRFS